MQVIANNEESIEAQSSKVIEPSCLIVTKTSPKATSKATVGKRICAAGTSTTPSRAPPPRSQRKRSYGYRLVQEDAAKRAKGKSDDHKREHYKFKIEKLKLENLKLQLDIEKLRLTYKLVIS